MARKPKAVRPEAEKTQAERFLETAREIGADETGEAFERALDRIVPPRRPAANCKPKEPAKREPVTKKRKRGDVDL